MEQQMATFKTGGSSASSTSSASASRRNSFAYLEKPSDTPGLSSFSSFASLKGLSASRVSLLPMPVVTTAANSALEVARSSFRWLPTSHITLPLHSPLPPFSPGSPPSPRLRALFGNCFYRRVIVWGAALLSFLILSLLVRQHQNPDGFQIQHPWQQQQPAKPDPEGIWLNYTLLDGYYNGVRMIVPVSQYKPQFPTAEESELARLEFTKPANETDEAEDVASVAKRDVSADPSAAAAAAAQQTAAPVAPATPDTPAKAAQPTPVPYRPQPDYNSSAYLSKYYPVQRCYLDAANQIPVPDLWAYEGVPQGQPKPLYGSHEVLGMRDDVCFDRFGRYGPYGMGYSREEGGIGQGLDTEREGMEAVWSTGVGKIDYTNVDWAAAQKRCYEANKERFLDVPENVHGATEYPKVKNAKRDVSETAEANTTTEDSAKATSGLEKLQRTAIVVRCYAGFKWTPHAVLNFRALVAELSLQSGGEYDIHILLHVRDESLPVWADAETADQFIADNIPAEFRGLVSTWSVAQMRVLYPSMFNQPVFENPSGADIHGVYRSPHLALQHFAQVHPEYDHYWNWEMDMRFLGSYYEFFNRLDKWSAAQPRRRIWDRSSKYYIPALHGSWDDFTKLVDSEAHEAGRPSILGEVFFAGRTSTRDEERGISPLPQGCEGASLSHYDRQSPDVNSTEPTTMRHFFADRNNNYTNIPEQCGVGEPADIITLNPMFDSEDSGWVFSNDVTGYNLDFAIPPRRTAIITASRLSRRLLFAMHEETWRLHHGMFAEMFPPTIALHRGFKAAYAPHPVYSDRRWPLMAVERAFNAGPDHSAGASRNSPFDQSNEHYHRGMSWYYNAEFAGRLWRRWLGYLQPLDDKTVPKTNSPEEEKTDTSLSGLGGGPGEEMRESGRMCMRSVLVHPIKFESLAEILP